MKKGDVAKTRICDKAPRVWHVESIGGADDGEQLVAIEFPGMNLLIGLTPRQAKITIKRIKEALRMIESEP